MENLKRKVDLTHVLIGALVAFSLLYYWRNDWYPIFGLIYILGVHIHHEYLGIALVALSLLRPKILKRLPNWGIGVILGAGLVFMIDDLHDLPGIVAAIQAGQVPA